MAKSDSSQLVKNDVQYIPKQSAFV